MSTSEWTSAARAVVDIARHFDRLKARATELLKLFRASERGFFTPSEDDEVRHLLVSYWQSRNALWEVVASCQKMELLPAECRPAAFLIGYAGALVLIDVARFLRNNFHDRPVVRQQLNRPEPTFGVPPGTYDRIQKSLTSPLHAWHLYQAVRYYQQQRDALADFVRGHDALEGLNEIIDERQGQLAVGLRQYAAARLRVRARELGTTVRRDLLGQALYGLQKAVSQFVSEIYVKEDHCPALPPEVAAAVRGLLRPGDVLITRKEYAATNYFLPGYWPHAAFFIGDAEELARLGLAAHANVAPRWHHLLTCDAAEPRRVLEALKDGVRARSLTSPLSCDSVAILRPLIGDPFIAHAIARGFSHEGKAYDFDFDFTRSDRLVCTEVVYRSYEGIGGIRFALTRRAGRLTLAAEDLLQMALAQNHFRLVAAYACGHTTTLAQDATAASVIRETMR